MKILVIGAGGIGSFFAGTLFNLKSAGQLPKNVSIVFYDPDTVEEKNIRYQNFTAADIGFDKVEAMEVRLGFDGVCKRIGLEDFPGIKADIIICAVDNAETRQAVFDFWRDTGTYFVDMRAEGRTVSFFTPGEATAAEDVTTRTERYDILTATLASAGTESGSCQRAVDMEAGIIQLGNQIIAPIGAQLLINHLRGISNPGRFVRRF